MKRILLMALLGLCLLPSLRAQGGEVSIVIDKQKFTLTLYDANQQVIKVYPVAVAVNYGNKERRGDHKTPEGTFAINELLNAKGLTHDFGGSVGVVKNAYGPWFLRLNVPGYRDIGIHGTPFPESIGSRSTEGCIRMTNEDIVDLKNRVKLGTKVTILPDPVN